VGIVTDYPSWFILLCFITGGVYSFSLYYRSRKDDLSPRLVWIMSILRFLSVSILAFLLLSPLIRKTSEIVEKPLILVAQDNSQSIVAGKDSAFYRNQYPALLKEMVEKLESKYEVVSEVFGEKVEGKLPPNFSERETDISNVFTEFRNRYVNRNIGAMILLSDGIYNKGINPVYSARNIDFPIYTVGLGDTLFYKDIILRKTTYNRNVFLGDKYPVEVEIEANQCLGEKSSVSILKGDQVLESRPLSFKGNKAFQKVTFILDARTKGIQHYTILVEPVEKEVNKSNNRNDIFIEVTETRQKIALLFQSPHPDITALRQALEGPGKYEITVKNINEFTESPAQFDLIILYQLPSLAGINNTARFLATKTSVLFILGTQSDLNAFNALKTGLQITSGKATVSESQPAFNPEFSLFTSDKNFASATAEYPPLLSPFGNYFFSPVSEVLFYQKMGNVTSRIPLYLFMQNAGQKIGAITGENLWKWRLSNFLSKGNHQLFDDLINKTVQYLTVKEDKSFFRIKCKDRYRENEPVEIEAEVYNESYEMVNVQDVNLTITDEEGKSYPFTLGKTPNAYYLNAGTFPVGKYNYSGSVKSGNTTYQKNGTFIVAPINLESMNIVADHNLLYRLSAAHGGELYYPQNMEKMVEKINSREDIRPVIYTQKRFSDLTGNLVAFLIILTLLSAEWFIRKRNGRY
jgi:hypothetical protein